MDWNILLLESVSEEAAIFLSANAQIFDGYSPDKATDFARNHAIHAIITRGKGQVDRELIDQCSKYLKVIARCGVGLDNVDVHYATQLGIPVVNAPGINADTVAEHTLSLMLCLQRQIFPSVLAVKSDHWAFRNTYSGDEIRQKTLGIIGMGNIGEKVARLASVFDMQVQYWKRNKDDRLPYEFCDWDQILSTSDIISLHLPLTDTTRNIIDSKAFKKMKDNVYLINTARGELVDENALINSLRNRKIAGYAADVMILEPPAKDHPLLQMGNVIITPHSASLTKTTYNELCLSTAKNVVSLLQGVLPDPYYIFNFSQIPLKSDT